MTSFAGPKVQLFHGSVEETLAAANGKHAAVQPEKTKIPNVRIDTSMEIPGDAVPAFASPGAKNPSGSLGAAPLGFQQISGASLEDLGSALLPTANKKPLVALADAKPDPREIYLPREFEPNSLPKVGKLGASVDLCVATELAGNPNSIREVCDKVSLNVEMDPGGALLKLRSKW